MPEGIEAEQARVLLDDRLRERRIAKVFTPDAWFLKRGLTPAGARRSLRGQRVEGARRRGKLILLDTTGPVLGVHLGMSGRVLVDGEEAGDPLIYASNRDVPAWIRFGLHFEDGGSMLLRDPRRLGAVELDPDEDRLGPDAFSLTRRELRSAIASSSAPVKAALMDQSRVAGLGNLLCDEILWRAGINPARPARSLADDETKTLHRAIRRTVSQLSSRGGSHTGDLVAERRPGGVCPKDGTELQRWKVGGRTTYSCPMHQA